MPKFLNATTRNAHVQCVTHRVDRVKMIVSHAIDKTVRAVFNWCVMLALSIALVTTF